MTDDDEPPQAGKMFYSGINPDAERAEYALPLGEPALQDGEPEYPAPKLSALVTRRWVLTGIGGAVAAAGTYFALSPGARRTDDAPVPQQKVSRHTAWLVRGAQGAAQGDIDQLVGSYGTFIMVVEDYAPEDHILWDGIERLGMFALSDSSSRGARIGRRLLQMFAQVSPPRKLAWLPLRLREMIAALEKRGK
ncbi:MAG: hypothetical protein H6837_20590 [Planctomycetes bacterium]|nr:hypothetical protein [Planctomycetota bacterium]